MPRTPVRIHAAHCHCFDCSDDPLLHRFRAPRRLTGMCLAKARLDAALIALIAASGSAAVISQFFAR